MIRNAINALISKYALIIKVITLMSLALLMETNLGLKIFFQLSLNVKRLTRRHQKKLLEEIFLEF